MQTYNTQIWRSSIQKKSIDLNIIGKYANVIGEVNFFFILALTPKSHIYQTNIESFTIESFVWDGWSWDMMESFNQFSRDT